VLAQIHEPKGFNETLVNVLVHYVVPIMMIVGWLAFGPRPRIGGATVLWSLLYPASWMVYTLVRGAIWKWHPYPFVDVTTHGYGQVALSALGVVVVLGVVAALVPPSEIESYRRRPLRLVETAAPTRCRRARSDAPAAPPAPAPDSPAGRG
jgi:hypothetical protein